MGRIVFWIAVVLAALLTAATDVPAAYFFAPLLAVAVLWFGLGSLRSLQMRPDHVPEGDPSPVDPSVERTTYWCAGCGTEVLLLVRGSGAAPRHCGERMHERIEVSGERRSGNP